MTPEQHQKLNVAALMVPAFLVSQWNIAIHGDVVRIALGEALPTGDADAAFRAAVVFDRKMFIAFLEACQDVLAAKPPQIGISEWTPTPR